jgi:hypothetical protein
MRIIFGIMSAVQPAATVASLVDTLGPDHRVMVHHDWSQQPDFPLRRPNLSYVEQPERTGWANWGFSRGILKLVAEAVTREQFDYFQLLSPTCLPVRPMAEFEAHLAQCGADFLVDAVRLDSDPNVLMSHGWRAFAAADSTRQRILRRARKWYFGNDAVVESRDGLSFPVNSFVDAPGLAGMKARLGHAITLQAARGHGFSHPFSEAFPCYAGSTWFTASRRGCAHLLEQARDEALTGAFARMHMGDEMYFPSIFRNSGLPCGPAVHHIAGFIDARPAWFDLSSLDEIRRSRAFFARKFPEDPVSPVRVAVRQMVTAKPEPVAAPAMARRV